MKESDIRPSSLFEEYLRLSAKDADVYFSNVSKSHVQCPACRVSERTYQFSKNSFEYATCDNCQSLYLTPRHGIDAFERFYNNSPSSIFWAEKFYPEVAEARRKRIFIPRIEKLVDYCREKGINPQTIVDVGAGYGIFLEEWKRKFPQSRTIAIEPSPQLADVCRKKKLEVVEKIAEKTVGYEGVADLLVCFEVLEHVYNPVKYIRTLASFVKTDRYLLVSTLGFDGFDIQTLWDKSNSISPPHHINFLSNMGFKYLFENAGFKDIEITTPGKLDVDIVRNAYKKDSSLLDGHRFIKKIIKDDALSKSFQEFLIKECLSSHVWIFARKPKR